MCLHVSDNYGYSFGLLVCPTHSMSFEGNVFKFAANVHLDSRMNLLDLGGQRSRSM